MLLYLLIYRMKFFKLSYFVLLPGDRSNQEKARGKEIAREQKITHKKKEKSE